MKLNDDARALIGAGAAATLVTLNPDGSPQATLVWVAVEPTIGGDELLIGHLREHQKVHNVRRDPRVALTILGPDTGKIMRPYLTITGTGRVHAGGAPELLARLAKTMTSPGTKFPPDNAGRGWVTRIQIDKVGGVGPWAGC